MQQPRQQYDLERQGQAGRQIQMTLTGAPSQEKGRYEEEYPLYREQVDEGHDAPLREHRKRQEQQQRSTQVQELQVERDSGHGSSSE